MASYVWPSQGGGGVTSLNSLTGDLVITAGTGITVTPSGSNIVIAATGGSGTVTTVSVVSANGLSGTVANPTTTPAITLVPTFTGITYSTGSALQAAIAANFPTLNQNTTGTASNITATSNSTLTTLSSLSLPGSQVSGNISGNAANVTGTVLVANGGTGDTSFTAYAPIAGGTTTTGALQSLSSGMSNVGYVLTSTGTSSAPTWQASGGGGGSGFNYLSSNLSVYGGTNSTLSFTGADNTVVGVGAGAALTSGTDNTLYGYEAGNAIVSGNFNTFIGSKPSTSYTASGGMLIGYETDSTNVLTSDTYVLAIGNSMTFQGAGGSGFSTLIGHTINATNAGGYNTAVGCNAAVGGSAGNNVAMGYQATANTYSVGIGSRAESGDNSVTIGAAANTSANSVGIGYNAGNGGAGADLIAIGYMVQGYQCTGSTMIGYQLQPYANQYCVAFGFASSAYNPLSGNNQISFGTTSQALANMYLGAGAAAVASPVSCSIQPTPGSGSNVAGANLTITAGNGTGSGGSGSISFQTAPTAGSSSTANTLATVMSLTPAGGITANNLTGYMYANGSSAITAATTIPTSSLSGSVSLTTQVSGVLPILNGGTGQTTANAAFAALSPMTTLGDIIIGGSGGTPTRLANGTTGQVLMATTSAAETWQTVPGNTSILKAPTVQQFATYGTLAGWLFTISTSSTCAIGDTYTTGGETYTVLAALSSQSGQVLYMSQALYSPGASGTLTRSSGSGTSSIAFTASVQLGLYTLPSGPTPLYLRVRLVGGGGGGAGSGTSTSGGTGGTGGTTVFGAGGLLLCNGGTGGTPADSSEGGTGGTASIGSGPKGLAITGANGNGAAASLASSYIASGAGGSSPFGGAGAAALNNTSYAGVSGTGSGGSGCGNNGTTTYSGSGGAAGGYIDALISAPASTYYFTVGAAGTAGTAGSSGYVGGAGGSGYLIVEELYQ